MADRISLPAALIAALVNAYDAKRNELTDDIELQAALGRAAWEHFATGREPLVRVDDEAA